jgi:hypothetical protein
VRSRRAFRGRAGPARSAAALLPSVIMVNSSSVAPRTSGLPAPTPARSDSSVERGIRSPSIVGPHGSRHPAARTRRPSDRRRLRLPLLRSEQPLLGTEANPSRVGADTGAGDREARREGAPRSRRRRRRGRRRAPTRNGRDPGPPASEQRQHRSAAGGLPEMVTRDGSPAERGDVVAHPLERREPVAHARLEGAPGMCRSRRNRVGTRSSPSRRHRG